jgi:hypothetical protein
MLVCNYCKRNFKEEYKNCPGCGSNSFKKIDNKLEYIIDTPPKDGYKLIGYSELVINNTGKNIIYIVSFIIMTVILLINILVALLLSSGNIFSIPVILFLSIIVIIYIILSILLLSAKKKDTNNKTKTRKEILQTEGVLYKNLPYEIETVEYKDSDDHLHRYYKIKITYTLNDGVKREFFSKPNYDSKSFINKNGTADLLVDPNDYTNYFVDIEIY